MTHFLGAWGSHITLPSVTDANPASALLGLAEAKPWTPAPKADFAPRYATEQEPDTRPAVWLANPSGAIHNMSASDADKALKTPGYRPATEAEVRNELRRQGLTPQN
jgi:hypothetical protein